MNGLVDPSPGPDPWFVSMSVNADVTWFYTNEAHTRMIPLLGPSADWATWEAWAATTEPS